MTATLVPSQANHSESPSPLPVRWSLAEFRRGPVPDGTSANLVLHLSTHDYRVLLAAADAAAAAVEPAERTRRAELLATLPLATAAQQAEADWERHQVKVGELRQTLELKTGAAREAVRSNADPGRYLEAALVAERTLAILAQVGEELRDQARVKREQLEGAIAADLRAAQRTRIEEAKQARAAALARLRDGLGALLTEYQRAFEVVFRLTGEV